MIATRSLPGSRTVSRAMALLKAFDSSRPAWRLADLARSSHLHKATAHRLLAALEREGMVARDAGGELYRLGPEAIALGARAVRATDLRTVSRGELEALAAQSGETATLEVLVGHEMLIADEVLGGSLIGVNRSLGERWPAHATSTGKALLAALDDGARATAVPARLPRFTPHTIVSRAALDRALDEVRRRGYAVASEELEVGYVAVGTAVRGHDGGPVAAISLGGPAQRMIPKRVAVLGRSVVQAAERISAALGYRGQA
jgi:DNA-binding IclR family transcriptional regulator